MKKMACELCGSNSFTKDDDSFFVCDYCRTKYTTEQAKKMMVEGTVSLDRRSEAASAVRLARMRLGHDYNSEVAQHVKRALELDPECAAAWQLEGVLNYYRSREYPEKEFGHANDFATTAELAEFAEEQNEIKSKIDYRQRRSADFAREDAERKEYLRQILVRYGFGTFVPLVLALLVVQSSLGLSAVLFGISCAVFIPWTYKELRLAFKPYESLKP